MKTIGYTYSIIKYVHNPAAGEQLNIGVILCAPDASFVGGLWEQNYERLSKTFANFDGTHYRRVIRRLQTVLENLRLRSAVTLIKLHEDINDAAQLGRMLLPDSDLSFTAGPLLAGVTHDPQAELRHIFERLVTAQYLAQRVEHRSDDNVWQTIYRPLLAQNKVTEYLEAKEFTAEDYSLQWEHSFKNGKWHVLEPVTMDYARAGALQEKAAKLLGQATVIKGHPDLGKIYLLLGQPLNEEHFAEYAKAKNLLHKMPVPHQLVEEHEAAQFAADLAAYLREHAGKTLDT